MQLIVSAIPETAVKSDSAALEIVVDDLKERGLLPDRLLADTAYGSDDNDILCRSENISLVSPASGKCPADQIDPDAITVSDFRVEDGETTDEYGRTIIVPTCAECPSGQKPHRSFFKKVDGWNLLRSTSVRSLIVKLTKGGKAGQSALCFATSYRRLAIFSAILVA